MGMKSPATVSGLVWKASFPPQAKTLCPLSRECGEARGTKNKVEEIILPNIKVYYVAVVINIVWYWQRDRHIQQWNRIKIPGICLIDF